MEILKHASRGLLIDKLAAENDMQFALYLLITIALVLMAGLMSGLTLGLMSLDMVDLEVFRRSGTPEEKAHAAKILPVIKHQHHLLVTLLLCNAAATEALPIFIDRLADPITAILVSVTVVLFFGEILPQSICARYGLKVGAYSAWFVKIIMFICSPIAWPIGKVLDYALGHGQTALFRRAQLKVLVDLHGERAGLGGTLSHDEINIIRGALDLTNKTAWKGMTPLEKVFMLSSDQVMDEATLQAILDSGHSRIPVYQNGNRKDIQGIILVKELLLINPANRTKVGSLRIRVLPRLSAETPMYDMLKLFETGRSHMAILIRPSGSSFLTGSVDSTGAPEPQAGEPSGTNRGEDYIVDIHNTQSIHYTEGGDPSLSVAGGEELMSMNDTSGEPVGIITIEDVIEELLQEEIVDETDLYVDNMQTSKVNSAMLARSLPPRLRKVLSAGIFTPRVGRLAVGAGKGVKADRSKSAPASAPLPATHEGFLESDEELDPDYVDYTNRVELEDGDGHVDLVAPLLPRSQPVGMAAVVARLTPRGKQGGTP